MELGYFPPNREGEDEIYGIGPSTDPDLEGRASVVLEMMQGNTSGVDRAYLDDVWEVLEGREVEVEAGSGVPSVPAGDYPGGPFVDAVTDGYHSLRAVRGEGEDVEHYFLYGEDRWEMESVDVNGTVVRSPATLFAKIDVYEDVAVANLWQEHPRVWLGEEWNL